jgi:MEMO1 family protein
MKFYLLAACLLFISLSLFAGTKVRPSILAGSWYPGSKDELNKQLDAYFAQAQEKVSVKLDNAPLALIVPHAGYIYSGYGDATGYFLLQKYSYDRVIILALSHSVPLNGIAVSDFSAFQTPLGEVPADVAVNAELLKNKKLFKVIPEIDAKEHSMEIQIPFIQKAAPSAKIVGLYVGQLNENEFKEAAEILKQYVAPKTLFVASSDFTHYGENYGYMPFPKDEKTRKYLAMLDGGAITEITALNPKGFLNHIQNTGDTICGRNPIALLLYTLTALKNKSIQGTLVNYYTSGELVGDFTNSVSYTTIAFAENKAQKENPYSGLTDDEKKYLLKLARESIQFYFTNNSLMSIDEKQTPLSKNLKETRGVFVTLKIKGQLRGCIGHIEPVQELYKDVIENAVNAAFKDPRFSPLTQEEFKKVDLEISALTPFRKVNSLDEIKIGKHGLIIRKGFYSGVFLPQVPVEQGWNLQEYLENLCYKAGLNKDDYKDANLFMFSAEVFSELELLKPSKHK